MPFINVKVNGKITDEKEKNIKTKLGKAIEIIPGKLEAHLMIAFEDEQRMYFRGKNDKPMAFIEVKILGKATSQAYNELTAAICDIFEKELGISPSQIYVKYEETEHWGFIG
jgi:phenylpyruvate tautomerase PptA (4-oxalocrotonate tautomerase family)